ncbi:hypothetical protein N643_12545 [Salmonella bongori serovar 48:z41:-- str. RKS3044]|nr:hypothetical protein N643_12545 [Salmonella bongori serovar 48:z41:-- str. RKS3044]
MRGYVPVSKADLSDKTQIKDKVNGGSNNN